MKVHNRYAGSRKALHMVERQIYTCLVPYAGGRCRALHRGRINEWNLVRIRDRRWVGDRRGRHDSCSDVPEAGEVPQRQHIRCAGRLEAAFDAREFGSDTTQGWDRHEGKARRGIHNVGVESNEALGRGDLRRNHKDAETRRELRQGKSQRATENRKTTPARPSEGVRKGKGDRQTDTVLGMGEGTPAHAGTARTEQIGVAEEVSPGGIREGNEEGETGMMKPCWRVAHSIGIIKK